MSVEINLSSSPRKLQEMSIRTPDGHDVTSASGVSMKQYEEQLNALRKENFQLKLRIYFLEEKLGSGAPPALQGLLEHNVRLQVEAEELRRQLHAKQQLLQAAAEAIDVLEQQGSAAASLDLSSASRAALQSTDEKDPTDETAPESESAGARVSAEGRADPTEPASRSEERAEDELARLRRENRKALQLIKGCTAKVRRQARLEELLRDSERRVRALEAQLAERDPLEGNMQRVLTQRLQGLARFLDGLLAHKCVLGEDERRQAESMLESSLAPLEADDSGATELPPPDDSALTLRDLTLLLGHHRAHRAHHRDSDSWSEPDRGVSLQRMGLRAPAEPAEAEERPRPRRPRRSDEAADERRELQERLARAEGAAEGARQERRELREALDAAERALKASRDEAALEASAEALARAQQTRERLRLERELADAQERLASALDRAARLEADATRRAADEAEAEEQAGAGAEELSERATSPDQGIDSDRLSSLEAAEGPAGAEAGRALLEENLGLRQKLSRCKATLLDALQQLHAANARKSGVQRAICREIHKTHGVLRRARDCLEP